MQNINIFNQRIFSILQNDKDYRCNNIEIFIDSDKRNKTELLNNIVFKKGDISYKIYAPLIFTNIGKCKIIKLITQKKGHSLKEINFTEKMRLDEIKFFVMKKFNLLDEN